MMSRSIPDVGIGCQTHPDNDGTNWALGTPSKAGLIIHDGAMDFDGNLWFTSNATNKLVTVGRIDAKTGAVKSLKVHRADGRAANAHGIARDGDGNLWFDVNPGRRSLGKVDPKTEKITVYPTPENMSPLGGAVTVDVDGKGMVWASAPDGVLRFDPEEEKFTEFKSKNHQDARTARPTPMAQPATATAMAGGRRWPSTRSARPTSRPAGTTEIVLPGTRRRWTSSRRSSRGL